MAIHLTLELDVPLEHLERVLRDIERICGNDSVVDGHMFYRRGDASMEAVRAVHREVFGDMPMPVLFSRSDVEAIKEALRGGVPDKGANA